MGGLGRLCGGDNYRFHALREHVQRRGNTVYLRSLRVSDSGRSHQDASERHSSEYPECSDHGTRLWHQYSGGRAWYLCLQSGFRRCAAGGNRSPVGDVYSKQHVGLYRRDRHQFYCRYQGDADPQLADPGSDRGRHRAGQHPARCYGHIPGRDSPRNIQLHRVASQHPGAGRGTRCRDVDVAGGLRTQQYRRLHQCYGNSTDRGRQHRLHRRQWIARVLQWRLLLL